MIYFLQAEAGGPIKIGYTTNAETMASRRSSLQIGNPYFLVVLSMIEGGKREERALHRYFKKARLRGEWFEPWPELAELAGIGAENGSYDLWKFKPLEPARKVVRLLGEGVNVRHRRSCLFESEGRCTCDPGFRAEVWSPQDKKRIRRTFPTYEEAKTWRMMMATQQAAA